MTFLPDTNEVFHCEVAMFASSLVTFLPDTNEVFHCEVAMFASSLMTFLPDTNEVFHCEVAMFASSLVTFLPDTNEVFHCEVAMFASSYTVDNHLKLSPNNFSSTLLNLTHTQAERKCYIRAHHICTASAHRYYCSVDTLH